MRKKEPEGAYEERFNLYLDKLKRGVMPGRAAEEAGLPRRAVKRLRETNKDFREAEEDARDYFSEKIEAKLADLALDGDMSAIALWLKANNVVKYNLTQKVYHQHELTADDDVKGLLGDIHALRARLEARPAPAELPQFVILDAEVVEDDELD